MFNNIFIDQAFYAGGSVHSGQQILGPGKNRNDIIADMFKSIREWVVLTIFLTVWMFLLLFLIYGKIQAWGYNNE